MDENDRCGGTKTISVGDGTHSVEMTDKVRFGIII